MRSHQQIKRLWEPRAAWKVGVRESTATSGQMDKSMVCKDPGAHGALSQARVPAGARSCSLTPPSVRRAPVVRVRGKGLQPHHTFLVHQKELLDTIGEAFTAVRQLPLTEALVSGPQAV